MPRCTTTPIRQNRSHRRNHRLGRAFAVPGLLLSLLLSGTVPAQPAPSPLPPEPPPVTADEYAQRRGAVIEAIGPDSLLVLLAPRPAVRNGDVSWPFRQDDDLYWLTGVTEPQTALVLVPGEGRYREVLFAPDRDPAAEMWTGPIPEHGELAEASGVAEVHSAGEILPFLEAALGNRPWGESDVYRYYREPAVPRFGRAVREGRAQVWLDLGREGTGERDLLDPFAGLTQEQRLAQRIRDSFPEIQVRDAYPLLADLREVKSPAEVAHLQRAIDVTGKAIEAAMRRSLTAETENQVQAAVEGTFLDLGACCWGYPSIVAAGDNTTILHYEAGTDPVPRDGLVLLDVGADYRGYTADVTRTFPADGTFSDDQRAVYEAVQRTWDGILPEMRPGKRMVDVHRKALELLAGELLELGLVSEATPEQAELYFPHGLGHPLGLRVHDEFDRTRPFEPGMVWTIEPGIYVRPQDVEASEVFQGLDEAAQDSIRAALERYAGIGIRTEDDVLITDGAPEVLSEGIPRSVEEIEGWMAGETAPAR